MIKKDKTYDIDTSIPSHCNDGIQGPKIHANDTHFCGGERVGLGEESRRTQTKLYFEWSFTLMLALLCAKKCP